MNPRLNQLQPYPFQKLRELFAGVTPDPALAAINLSIGEPKHATPAFIREALTANLQGLASYPATQGSDDLRATIADWCRMRYGAELDPATQILPVNGSREALFAFAQAVIDPGKHVKRVVSPNPFYQIYEGAALLAGAKPYFLNTLPDNGFHMDLGAVPEDLWADTHLLYVCSPGNPTGKVMALDEWQTVFELADRHGFAIAADECYSEIYFDEDAPPLGALTAAKQLGRGLERLVVFNSLSKRSNVPGLRSGFVAGDAELIRQFLLYRTYHGSAMNPAVQAASAAAWRDETHVRENRRQYREKFAAVMPVLSGVLDFTAPDAAFYLWAKVPGGDDAHYARELYRQQHVTVLPGSFLAREARGVNPGRGFIRIALVDALEPTLQAARRIADFGAGSA
ncbi:MAG: N-succinyldiaminopimelate aminotransferase [bacterium]|nr:MAG: N-succinyldiaminopimelate aminotransferase [bacterium]KAF0148377.1 MAG: N-succinyldiaminopimelate aminotransferase [bacterium]KAF0166042.1 MAG: N-succinyldiaminopimelate aminotransferase [bacterium]TXT20185.1 MAG: N-succinyldiaminopimelate aminotransferase [bacterium]